MAAYYNEIDPGAAAWLRELIKAGLIAPGIVDERDIRDVRPDELLEFAQCHFFAGIGGWSLALRGAGWADDRPVWTGSCPCQPFSAAGKRGGTSDERHLWPHWFHLIEQCRPPVVFGEQVASKDGLGWFDLVSADLEGSGYAVGAADLCTAGVGAPHIRQRLWFVGVADAGSQRHDREQVRLQPGQPRPAGSEVAGGRGLIPLEHASGDGRLEWRAGADGRGVASGCGLGGLADRDDAGLEGRRQPGRERAAQRAAGPGGVAGGLADADGRDARSEREQPCGQQRQQPQDGGIGGLADAASAGRERRWTSQAGDGGDTPRVELERLCHAGRPGPVNGFWRDADWLFCRDGKWRPVEPRTFPLAHGVSGRVGLLRGYGNAISPQAAEAFIRAADEVMA